MFRLHVPVARRRDALGCRAERMQPIRAVGAAPPQPGS